MNEPRPPDPDAAARPAPPRGEEAARLLEAALHGEASGGRRVEPPSPEALAARFPDLEIQELVGAGGMGVVYRARHRRLDRLVALKVLPEHLGRDPAFAERFAREARTLARLDHPHIVRVHDFGETGGLYYLVLEYVDGANLREVMSAGRLTPPEALAIVPQVCEALQYAHDQGVVHRDIKPENVLLDRRGNVKIADFGLAKLVGTPAGEAGLTETGQVMGTVQYMAPEQYRTPQDVDHRADIFSLGVVFYEMLTGELPMGRFRAPSEAAHLDARIDRIVLRALERERALRYQRAEELRTDVRSVAAPGPARPPAPPSSARPGRSGRASVLLAALALPAGLAAVVAVHDAWGGVVRGTDDAFLREAWKGVAGAVLWAAGTVLGFVAALRGFGAPAPRWIHRAGVLLALGNLGLLVALGLYVASETHRHANPTPAPASGFPWPARSVRGLPPGEDPRPIMDSVERAWAAYAGQVDEVAHQPWDWRQATPLYDGASRRALDEMSSAERDAALAERRGGIAVLSPAHLGTHPLVLRVQRIDVDPTGRRATVRVVHERRASGFTFPVARDADGEWRFALGPVLGFADEPTIPPRSR